MGFQMYRPAIFRDIGFRYHPGDLAKNRNLCNRNIDDVLLRDTSKSL